MEFNDFLNAGQSVWRETFGLTLPTQLYIENNRAEIDKLAFEWQVQLTPMNVEIIDRFSPSYPTMLNEFFDVPPPVLYLSGNRKVIDFRPKISFLNSRILSTRGKELLNRFLASISETFTTIASFYRTPYRKVAEAALERNSPLILVSDRGLLQAKRSKLFKNLHENTLVLSPFAPDDVGTASSGPRRDAIIVALSDVLVGLEIREGGTMDRLLSRAIKMGKTVWIYKPRYITSSTTGNWKLIELGAKPFDIEENILSKILSSI